MNMELTWNLVFGQKSFRSLVDLTLTFPVFDHLFGGRDDDIDGLIVRQFLIERVEKNKQIDVVIVYDMRQLNCSTAFQMNLILTYAALHYNSGQYLPNLFIYLFCRSFSAFVVRLQKFHSAGTMCARV